MSSDTCETVRPDGRYYEICRIVICDVTQCVKIPRPFTEKPALKLFTSRYLHNQCKSLENLIEANYFTYLPLLYHVRNLFSTILSCVTF
jgi:hypothetical protein